MGILSGNPKEEPMHYGEVFGAWSFLTAAKAMIAAYQTKINHVGDKELKELIEEAIKQCKQEEKEIEALLKENGVGLPQTPPDRPKAALEEIPVGARFLDQEISAALSASIAAGLVACSTIMGESLREDIGMMFGQFHLQKAALGVKALRLAKEKGWIIVPPLHNHHLTKEEK